ncbi:MAG TPA: hypothetical protein VFB02_16580 [Bradyrhizobium sp.]|nr:hypothetical protein [Bradyrhizobium sp.]
MKQQPKFFDANGNEIDETEAFDHRGVMRDQCAMRVPMWLSDASRSGDAADPRTQYGAYPASSKAGSPCTKDGRPGILRRGRDGILFCDVGRAADSKPQVNDGTTNPLGLHKPGYRYSSDVSTSDARRQVIDESYSKYERSARNAWRGARDATECDGSGHCPLCDEEGCVYSDDVDQAVFNASTHTETGQADSQRMMQDQRRAQAYAEYDRDVSSAWRGDLK